MSTEWLYQRFQEYGDFIYACKEINLDDTLKFSNIYFEPISWGRIFRIRRCVCSLWYKTNNSFKAIGFLGLTTTGNAKCSELCGKLFFGNKEIDCFVNANGVFSLFLGDSKLGSFEPISKFSKFMQLGSVKFETNFSMKGTVKLPCFWFWNQISAIEGTIGNNLIGRVLIAGKTSKFLIFPRFTYKKNGISNGCRMPEFDALPIFMDVPCNTISFNDNIFLLFIFCRSIAYYAIGSG